jgi:hypothetical protein
LVVTPGFRMADIFMRMSCASFPAARISSISRRVFRNDRHGD